MKISDILEPTTQKFLGKSVAQAPMAFLIFPKFLEKERFDSIIEIGSGTGTLSLFLAFCCHLNKSDFLTIDKKKISEEVCNSIKLLGGRFYQTDVYANNCMELIKNEFNSKKRVLLLCDGAIKKRCINTFSQYLKVNDVIMGHDYFESKQIFKAQKHWRSCELIDSDIEKTCKDHNLEKLYEDVFNTIYWTCR